MRNGGPVPVDSRRYIFGFHPHGLYPTGAGLLPLSPSFRSAFPGTSPVTLVRGRLPDSFWLVCLT